MRFLIASWLILLHVTPSSSRAQYDKEPGPKSPAESLKCMKPRPGFTVELMAAEPLVMDPIAFAWGSDGKFWVVEMGDYPLGVDGKGKPGGRVKFLEKTGKFSGEPKATADQVPYDKATVFLDNLGYPTGVMPWGKGVLVTCAPDIFYAEDTNGDGKADKKIVLFTGFAEGNQQHRVNSLVWGLDNWIYGANGDSGGTIKSQKTGQTVNISGRDFRFKPDTGAFEAVTGQTQFGRCRDDWGNWFGCNNSNPCFHFVLDDHYLRRNPHVPYPNPKVPVPEKPGAAPVFPISKPLPRFNDPGGLNHFTSACSITIYRDNLFGKDFENNTFVSEPVHNLIHREILTPKGVTFTSKRAADEQKSEFLASTDNWFRPAMIQTGPDGALWVADMYRYVIEHPQWIPKEWQKKLDLRAGHDKGRIYRIFPEGKRPRPIPRLDKLSPKQLVQALDSPSGWQRDMAQMLLVRGKKEAGFEMQRTLGVIVEYHRNPLVRLQALCILEDRDRVLEVALRDDHPGVRRHAVRLCRPVYSGPGIGSPDILEAALLQHLQEPDAGVVLQLAYALGQDWGHSGGLPPRPRDAAQKGLALLAIKHGKDPYILAGVLSSLDKHNWRTFADEVRTRHEGKPIPGHLAAPILRLAAALGKKDEAAVHTLWFLASSLDSGKPPRLDHFKSVAQLLDTIESQKSSLTRLRKESKWNVEEEREWRKVAELFSAARKAANDPKAEKTERLTALRLLGRGLDQKEADIRTLSGFLVPQQANDMQAAAIGGLGGLSDPRIPELLIRPWKTYSPTLRGQVLEVLLSRPEGVKATLDALAKKKILPLDFDAARRQRLLEHKDQEIRNRAAKLLAGSVDADRRKVVESYRPALRLAADAGRGAKVFAKSCAACHRLGDVGHKSGPDLASVLDKSGEGLLNAILDPNQAVEPRYLGYTAITKGGRTFSGLLAQESSTAIILAGSDGKEQTLQRTDLEELFSTGKSAMPEGLEKDIPPQEMADLLAFLQSRLSRPK